MLEGLARFWSTPYELCSGTTGGGQASAGACCALVKTAVLRAGHATDLLGDPLSFVWRPDRWTKTVAGESRATCALGRPHGNQTVKKSKLTS